MSGLLDYLSSWFKDDENKMENESVENIPKENNDMKCGGITEEMLKGVHLKQNNILNNCNKNFEGITPDILKSVHLKAANKNILPSLHCHNTSKKFNLYMLNNEQLKEILNVKLRPTIVKIKPQFYPARSPLMTELISKTANRRYKYSPEMF